jgi:hypothetical protein
MYCGLIAGGQLIAILVRFSRMDFISLQYRSLFLSAIKPRLLDSAIAGKDISLRFLTTDYNLGTPVDDVVQPSTCELTVITNPAPWQLNSLSFSSNEYFRELRTREMGQSLLHTPVITSTQLPFMGNLRFCQALRPEMGVVWVAAQQTKGKGSICKIHRVGALTTYLSCLRQRVLVVSSFAESTYLFRHLFLPHGTHT